MEGIPNTNTIINHAFSNYNDKLDLVQKGSKVALAALIILGPGILILAATLISDAVNDLFDFIHPSTSEEKQAPKRNISSSTNLEAEKVVTLKDAHETADIYFPEMNPYLQTVTKY